MQISSTMKTVSDLQYEICSRCIDSSEIDGVYLSLENFTLLPSEDIAVVQNGDKIDVRRKLNKSKGAKKRLKIKNSEETTTVSLKETTIKLGSKIAVPSESASLASKSTSASQITTSVALSSSSSSSSGESSSSEDTSSSEEDNSQNTSASICHTITKSHKICASPSVLQPVTVVSTPSNSKHKRFTTESDATSVLSTKAMSGPPSTPVTVTQPPLPPFRSTVAPNHWFSSSSASKLSNKPAASRVSGVDKRPIPSTSTPNTAPPRNQGNRGVDNKPAWLTNVPRTPSSDRPPLPPGPPPSAPPLPPGPPSSAPGLVHNSWKGTASKPTVSSMLPYMQVENIDAVTYREHSQPHTAPSTLASSSPLNRDLPTASSATPSLTFPPSHSQDEEFLLEDMGNEQLTAPKRKKKKYEVISSAHPDFSAPERSYGSLHIDQEVSNDRSVLRVPIPLRHPVKVGDQIAYRTLSLCEETWSPTLSSITEGFVVNIKDSSIMLSLSPDGVSEQWEFTWDGVADAWLLVQANPLLPPPGSFSCSPTNGKGVSLLEEFASDLSRKKSRFLES